MKTATMFLTNVTVIDGAYISPSGAIVGASFNPKFLVTGPITAEEDVVIDFGKVKKRLKEIIDDKEAGFDHKVWLLEGWSDYELDLSAYLNQEAQPRAKIVTPRLQASGDNYYYRVIVPPKFQTAVERNLWSSKTLEQRLVREIEDHLNYRLSFEFPGVSVEVSLSTESSSLGSVGTEENMLRFRYTHGLRNSTSFGCQQPLHGHLSYLQLLGRSAGVFRSVSPGQLYQIRADLDNTVFVDESNIVQREADAITIAYQSLTRGEFRVKYRTPDTRVTMVPSETTVEHLVAFIRDRYRSAIEDSGATHLAVSEGLTKGAIVRLKD